MRAVVLSLVLLISTSAVQAQTPPKADGSEGMDRSDPNYVRCKKITQIGSLVKKERVCKTNAQWARIQDDMRRDGEDLVTRTRAGMCGEGGVSGNC